MARARQHTCGVCGVADKRLVHGPGWATTARSMGDPRAQRVRLAAWMHTRLCECWQYTPDAPGQRTMGAPPEEPPLE